MWFHNSRSVSKREKRCAIGFFDFGEKVSFRHNTDIYLPNEETEINIKELFENKGIDCDNAFNFKLSGFTINIFTLPLINTKDNNSIYIGIQDKDIKKDILCIEKDNKHRYYLLLPYFKLDKLNLTEGKYLKGDTQMSYHLGLFEMQVQDKTLKSAILVETISIKDKITLNEFFKNIVELLFYQQEYVYSVIGLSMETYFLTHKLTNSIYFFDFSDILNPKIGNIYCDKYSVYKIRNVDGKVSYFSYDTGRWFFQIRFIDDTYLIKDNCNGKYEKIKKLKKESFYSYFNMLLYDKQNNPYFPHEKNDDLHFDRYNDILFYKIKDFEHLPFSKLKNRDNRYIRFQFTPFNNLNLAYYYQYPDGKRDYLFEYCLLAKNKDTYIATKLNPKTITYKYKINREYKNTYHRYLYYVDNEYRVPYVQVWKDNKTKQVYGCILNMMGKRGVFDNEIIME